LDQLTPNEAYLHPLNDLLDYQFTVLRDTYNSRKCIAKLDTNGGTNYYEGSSSFKYIIRVYNCDGTVAMKGIKIMPLSMRDFMDGFLKYFELLYQSGQERIYNFEIQEYLLDIDSTLNFNYVKVGSPVFRSSMHGWLFTALSEDIKTEILQYIPKTFSLVNKEYYGVSIPYILKYCRRDQAKAFQEVCRRIRSKYPLDRIMEMYDSDMILYDLSKMFKHMERIVKRVLYANYQEALYAIIANLDLNKEWGRSGQTLGNIITGSLGKYFVYRPATVNSILCTLALRDDYLPSSNYMKNLYGLALTDWNIIYLLEKKTMAFLLSHNKIDHNRIYDSDIRGMTVGAIEALIECETYDMNAYNNTLANSIIDRILLGNLDLSMLEKLFTRQDFDPSYNENILLEKIIGNQNDCTLLVNIVLSDDRTDIYRNNNVLLPKLAASYPNQLLARLQTDLMFDNVEVMNQYVYPYLTIDYFLI
jgi:hypothetical protein